MTTASRRHSAASRRAYTGRGRIITPLKDRFGAQIRTHYPEEASIEIAIMEAEGAVFDDASGADAGVAAQ